MSTGAGDKKAAMPVYVAAGVALTCITLLFVMIPAFALPVLLQKGSGGVFSWNWQPYRGEFGILPMLTGSLLLSFSTLLTAWPLSLAICCWTLDRKPGALHSLTQGLLRFMTAIPTVVYGFAAVFLLTPLIRSGLGGSGMCWLGAALMLTLSVPEHLRLTAFSLGMNREQYLRHVALPSAGRGIWSGVMLAVGRSAEDTAVIMLTGVVANAGLPAGITAKFEALPFAVYYIAAQYRNQQELMTGFGAALLLLLLAGGMVLAAGRIEAGYQRRWAGNN